MCDLYKAELQKKKCIFRVSLFFLPGKKNVPVRFHIYKPQISIKIKFKFFSIHYHWVTVGCCYFPQTMYFH